ncbi:MAG: hypothetical protein IJ049_00905 [Oscillospiraceae bacterium]|nr:hypothetical protein [Oscillospiraceae bacterium]
MKGIKRFTIFALILLLLVGSTLGITSGLLGAVAADESNVIPLATSANQVTDSTGINPLLLQSNPTTGSGAEVESWITASDLEIFRLSYDENGAVTVRSADGTDKVIAPGTENSCTFKLKNTANSTVDYTLLVTAQISDETVELPIKVRLNSYSGAWLVGGDNSWAEVEDLDGVTDAARLAKNNYATYTLEWQWPFESGSDDYDSFLGNLTDGEDVALTINLEILTVEVEEPNNDSDQDNTKDTGNNSNTGKNNTGKNNTGKNNGSSGVKTGDESKLVIYIVVFAAAAVILVSVLFIRKRRKSRE